MKRGKYIAAKNCIVINYVMRNEDVKEKIKSIMVKDKVDSNSLVVAIEVKLKEEIERKGREKKSTEKECRTKKGVRGQKLERTEIEKNRSRGRMDRDERKSEG